MTVTRKRIFLSTLELSLAPLSAAIWVQWGKGTLPSDGATHAMLFGILAIAALLAFRFRRGRSFHVAALLAAVAAINFVPMTFGLHANTGYWQRELSIVAPILVFMLACLPERPVVGRAGLIRLLWLYAVAALLLFQLQTPWGGRVEAAVTSYLSPLWLSVLAASVVCVIALVRGTAFERSVAVLLPCVGLFFASPDQQTAKIWLLAASIVLLISLSQTTAALAFRDELTGLPARRALDEALRDLSGGYSLAMVDIDHFKKLNDRFGHQVGDEALRMVAAKVAGVTGGQAYRYGGEEFAVIFPRADLRQAKKHLEALRETIAKNRFVLRSRSRPRKKPATKGRPKKPSTSVKVTVSIGVAGTGAKRRLPNEVLKVADQQLYRAKRAGRNQVRAKSA